MPNLNTHYTHSLASRKLHIMKRGRHICTCLTVKINVFKLYVVYTILFILPEPLSWFQLK